MKKKKDDNLFILPLVTVSNWEKGVMVVERNDIWLRKNGLWYLQTLSKAGDYCCFACFKHSLLDKSIFFCETTRKNVQEIVNFFFPRYFCLFLQLPVMNNLVSKHCNCWDSLLGRYVWNGSSRENHSVLPANPQLQRVLATRNGEREKLVSNFWAALCSSPGTDFQGTHLHLI